MSWAEISKEVGWKTGSATGQFKRQVPSMEQALEITDRALKGGRGAIKQLLEWNRFCVIRIDPAGRDADCETISLIVDALRAAQPIADETRPPFDEVELLTWWTNRQAVRQRRESG